MDASNYVRLARYHNARGIRMLKCARGVESCGHHKAFIALAGNAFEARNRCMSMARLMLGKRKVFMYLIESLDFEGAYHGDFMGRDELEAAAAFERQCEVIGVAPGMYRATRCNRVRL